MASVRTCYGEFAAHRAECRVCRCRKHCRDFAASERALAVGRSNIAGVPEWIPAEVPPERPAPERKYTDEDLQLVIRFFLTLSVDEIRIVQMRLTSPEKSCVQIAKNLGISRKRIYEFFKKETERMPALVRLLYRKKMN